MAGVKGQVLGIPPLWMLGGAFALFIGFLLFIGFTSWFSTALFSQCWKTQVDAADSLLTFNGEIIPEAGLVLKDCLKEIVIGDNTKDPETGSLCARTCNSLLSGGNGLKVPVPEECIKACNKCGDRGIILLVPNIPELSIKNIISGGVDTFFRVYGDETICKDTGYHFVAERGADNGIDGLKLTPDKGNIACLSAVTREGKVYVSVDGYANSPFRTTDPEILAKSVCRRGGV